MIQKVVVLGSGSAGLLAALSFKRRLPQLEVEIVHDPATGVIGVGEGTTPIFVYHLFDFLGIKRKRFFEIARPTWKLGVRFLWGPRGTFHYTFDEQLDAQFTGLKMPNGFFCDDNFEDVSLPAALMRAGKVFTRQADRTPDIRNWHAYHIENANLVELLESEALASGVRTTEGRFAGVERGEGGLRAILLEDGRRVEGDFFIDASGFSGGLIERELGEPLESFGKTLFCDRAVVGGWERDAEPLLPYTTAETMESGWCWQIEHEHVINRGYVYCSEMTSDDDAVAEFRRKNPKVPESPRVLSFRSGYRRRHWMDNVVAIGNAAGFVEPLEASALMLVCNQCIQLLGFIQRSMLEPTPSVRKLYNRTRNEEAEVIRDFLGLHYKLNTAVDSPFWRRCREETDLYGIGELLEFYEENGPSGFARRLIPQATNDYGIEGFLVMLVGNKAPYRKHYQPSAKEMRVWNDQRALFAREARKGIDMNEALSFVRHPGWTWDGE